MKVRSLFVVVALVSSALVGPSQPASAANSGFPSRTLAESPSFYWRLSETSGTTVADATGQGQAGTIRGTVGFGAAGSPASDGDTSISLDQSSWIHSPTSIAAPTVFTIQTWFKTSTTAGGKIIGFGSGSSAISNSYDRHVWMDNTGVLHFGTYDGGIRILHTPLAYNDDQWHLVTATYGSSTASLYVDGKLIASGSHPTPVNYNGYWRLGADDLTNWNPTPTNRGIVGQFDEAAVWNSRVLTATEIDGLYGATAPLSHQDAVTVRVSPTLTFAISPRTAACNGAMPTGSVTTGTSLDLGRPTLVANTIASQNLSVTTNAAGGHSVFMGYSSGLSNGNGQTIADLPGASHAAPSAFAAPGTPAFGYTTSETNLPGGTATRFFDSGTNSPQWAPLTQAGDVVSSATAGFVNADEVCVAYQVGVGSGTPAATYSTTITYSAAPRF